MGEARPLAIRKDDAVDVRELVVLRREQLTPKMIRLVLGGPGLAGMPSATADDHVKLIFADPQTGVTRLPVRSADGRSLEWPRPFPPTREYTIRRLSSQECWIDFVVHPGGLASQWATQVEPGATIGIAGPKSGYHLPPGFTHHILLGDLTALPAIARWVEELAPEVRADVALLVPDRDEVQPMNEHDNIALSWFFADEADGGDPLLDFLAGLQLQPDRPVYLWAAGEAGMLKPIRAWARAHGFARGTCDIAGYWRRSATRPLPT